MARRGIILLVVLSMLTLFAVVGLTFVLYAQAKADAARIFREAQQGSGPDMAPQLLLDDFLRQWIFDLDDVGQPGLSSSLRGHSLARTMFGAKAPFTAGANTNTIAFNGVGRFRMTGLPAPFVAADNEYNFVNYQYFDSSYPSGGQVHDPEKVGWGAPGAPRPYSGGFNPPVTYPDLNMMCLAAVKADGTVLTPSYHRWWNWGSDWGTWKGRYRALRPRTVDHPGFPATPGTGDADVKNLVGAPGGNDSVWLYIGSPIKSLPDGRKYTVCFAPLIVDLDGRVNLNIHGNIRGTGQAHASNQGWGPWEVNLMRVLTQGGTEGSNIFKGNGTDRGRYGLDMQPTANPRTPSPAFTPPPFYAQADFDGFDLVNSAASQPYKLPGAAPPPDNSKSTYPMFNLPGPPPSSGYYNGSTTEMTNHPQVFSIFSPGTSDKAFDVANMKALLWDASSLADVQASEVGKLCPLNFADAKIRRLVTTLSFDLDRPGAAPWITDPTTSPYTITAPAVFPTGTPIAFPTPPTAISAQSPTGEFSSGDGRSATARAYGRVDLNRTLPDYPVPPVATGQIILPNPTFDQAQKARQGLAKEIFLRLVKVTGAFDLTSATPLPPAPASTAPFDTLRWLAQLAVNMVDYIDSDNHMTPFNWTSAGSTAFTTALAPQLATLDPTGQGWVCGTELPRLVLNEAYAEIRNDPADPLTMGMAGMAFKFQVNFWVELHNPLKDNAVPPPTDGSAADDGTVQLKYPGAGAAPPAYKITIATFTPPMPPAVPELAKPSNVFGEPLAADVKLDITDYAPDPMMTPPPPPTVDVNKVLASSALPPTVGAGNNRKFYVLGPKAEAKFDFRGIAPGTPFATNRLNAVGQNAMTYELMPGNTLPSPMPEHTILLRRLACPNIPFQIDPAMPNYNPYVTIDYIEKVQTWDERTNDNTGPRMAPSPDPRASVGRRQPFGAVLAEQQNQTATPAGQPKNTFFADNQPLKNPFDWLVHLDRKLTSPIDLLQVSAFKPHELTQKFVSGVNAHKHVAPWYNQNARLFRVLEFLETQNRAAGVQVGGRVPGKININTIWDDEVGFDFSRVFRAICDPQPGNQNSFAIAPPLPLTLPPSVADVDKIFTNLRNLRTPSSPTLNGVPTRAPWTSDRPFWGLAAPIGAVGDPQYPSANFVVGHGIAHTILRPFNWAAQTPAPATPTTRLFEFHNPTAPPAGTHPNVRQQLLNKIYNNLTTRSNVFALWLTTGFFEVTNATTQPVKLGAEIGAPTGQNVRHHMFAIVDRTALVIPGTTTYATCPTAVSSGGSVPINVGAPAMMGIVPGTLLTVDTGANQETVVVTSVGPGPGPVPAATQFTAKFNKTHTAGFAIQAHNTTMSLSAVMPAGTNTVPVVSIAGITPGSRLVVDTGANREAVVVSSVDTMASTFTATFTKDHGPGAVQVYNLTLHGNPGPQPLFVPVDNGALVPYYTIID